MWSRWNGLVFGVFKDNHAGYRIPDVNFHGLTLPVRLPQIDTVEGGVWSARADIDSCPESGTGPAGARKEAVETPFLEEMREAARLAVYRAMAQADPAPRLAWTDWRKAKEAGIEMPEPPAAVAPLASRHRRHRLLGRAVRLYSGGFRCPRIKSRASSGDAARPRAAPEAQALHRALGLTGFQDQAKPALRLFAPEPRFEGYPWYDALARVTGIETLVTVDGAARSLDSFMANPGERRRTGTARGHRDAPECPASAQIAAPLLA